MPPTPEAASLEGLNWFRVNVFQDSSRIAGLVVASECSYSALSDIVEPMAKFFPKFAFDPSDVMHEVIPLSKSDRETVITTANLCWQAGQNCMFVD